MKIKKWQPKQENIVSYTGNFNNGFVDGGHFRNFTGRLETTQAYYRYR